MKHLILFAIAFASSLAWAANDEALFEKDKIIPYVAALECPGSERLPRVKELVEWWKAGDPIRLPDKSMDQYVEDLKRRGQSISIKYANSMFQAPSSDIPNAEFADDGMIDPRSIGLPSKLYDCKVIPIAMDARLIRDGKPYLIARKIYDRLQPLDRYIVQLLLSGVKPSVIRAFFNPESFKGTAWERYQLSLAHQLPSFFTGEVEVYIGRDEPTFDGQTLVKGRVAVGDSSAIASFYADGKLRSLDGVSSSGTAIPIKIKGAKGIYQFESNYTKCGTAWYRPDGSLALCDGSFYNQDGQIIAKVDVLRAESSREYDSYAFTEDYSKRRRDIIIMDTSGKDQEFKIKNYPIVYDLSTFLSEPSCGYLRASNSGSNSKDNIVTINVPKDCLALIRLSYRNEPAPPKKEEDEDTDPPRETKKAAVKHTKKKARRR